MWESLIFSGITEVPRRETPEETEEEVSKFRTIIQFHVTHPLRSRKDGKPKNIVVKFEKREDKNEVLKAARSKLKECDSKDHDQFPPPEIIARRNDLWPEFRHHQQQGDTVKIYDEKFIVNGRQIRPVITNHLTKFMFLIKLSSQRTSYPLVQMLPQQNSQQQFPQPTPSFFPNIPR
ncbi:unnamed protein product [Mytilus edulis]|uniref:Uncharacterized protein n=1 Tax=Mytilus edulis TaxID=6550 RepID=A0A8S3RWY5_MYTED|nr:unnamed protein product [Mytilus edulis]